MANEPQETAHTEVVLAEPEGGWHEVYSDYGGGRLTCRTCPEPGNTALKQPCMTEINGLWERRLAEFRNAHPWKGEPIPW